MNRLISYLTNNTQSKKLFLLSLTSLLICDMQGGTKGSTDGSLLEKQKKKMTEMVKPTSSGRWKKTVENKAEGREKLLAKGVNFQKIWTNKGSKDVELLIAANKFKLVLQRQLQKKRTAELQESNNDSDEEVFV